MRLVLLFTLIACVQVTAQPEPPTDVADDATAVALSNDQLRDIERYRTTIEELESQVGPFDGALLEPLTGLYRTLLDAGRLDDARNVLERRLGLMRMQNGPIDSGQIPLVGEMINIDIQLQDWESVTDHFQYIEYLYMQDESADAGKRLLATCR